MGYQVFSKKEGTKDLTKAIKLMMANLKDMKEDSSYEIFNAIRVGRYMSGEAYYHEVDEYYECIGFEVEFEYNFNFDGKLTNLEKRVGFFSVWIGESHSMAPFTFEETYGPFGQVAHFSNGFGDHIEMTEHLATVEEVNEVIDQLNK